MPVHDNLGLRMKTFYEEIPKTKLMRRCPVAIRIDGKAFHTFTRKFQKPFDEILIESMQETMKYLCENIQGCVFGYTQSDEISLVLTDYENIRTDAWFGYNIQKMASVSASIATLAFNKRFKELVENAYHNNTFFEGEEEYKKYKQKFFTAMFDSRAFTIPAEEVCNCMIWRQQDAVRNSIESVGHTNFSNKQLQRKSCNDIIEMLCRKSK